MNKTGWKNTKLRSALAMGLAAVLACTTVVPSFSGGDEIHLINDLGGYGGADSVEAQMERDWNEDMVSVAKGAWLDAHTGEDRERNAASASALSRTSEPASLSDMSRSGDASAVSVAYDVFADYDEAAAVSAVNKYLKKAKRAEKKANGDFLRKMLRDAVIPEAGVPQDNDLKKEILALDKMNDDDYEVFRTDREYSPAAGDIIFVAGHIATNDESPASDSNVEKKDDGKVVKMAKPAEVQPVTINPATMSQMSHIIETEVVLLDQAVMQEAAAAQAEDTAEAAEDEELTLEKLEELAKKEREKALKRNAKHAVLAGIIIATPEDNQSDKITFLYSNEKEKVEIGVISKNEARIIGFADMEQLHDKYCGILEELEEQQEEEALLEEEALEKEEVPNEKTEYTWKKKNLTVTATLTDPDAIPDDAVLTVTPITKKTRGYNYQAYMDALSEEIASSNENNTVLYDVAFLVDEKDENGKKTGRTIELQPEDDKVKVNFRFGSAALTDEIGARDAEKVKVVHLPLAPEVKDSADTTKDATDIAAADITPEAIDARVSVGTKSSSINFETEDFSVYAIVYTVDFEYVDENGNKYSWSWPGEGSYRVADILAELGIVGNVEKAEVELVEGESVEGALYLTTHNNEYYLNSDIAFDDVYKLTIYIDGKKYIFTVTDDNLTDINNMVSGVSVMSGSTEVQDGSTVILGRTYSFMVAFKETTEGNQFDTRNPLIYHVPDGIEMTEEMGTFSISYGGNTYTGNTFQYNKSTGNITINFTDTLKSLIATSGDTNFNINIEGRFTEQKDQYDFGNGVVKQYTVDASHDTDVNKTGYYDANDNKMHYTVTASSTGVSDNVVITDILTGTALNYDQGSLTINGNSSTPSTQENSNGFVVTLPSMQDNETVRITYTASVDFGSLTGKGTAEQTGNTVKIKADNDPEIEKPTNVANQIDYNPMHKSAGTATGEGNTKTLPWTITVNSQQLKSMAGVTITDRINDNSRDVMSYSGTGITVSVMDGSSVVSSYTVPWSEIGVDNAETDKTWHYTIPDTDDNRNNTYKYVITYNTVVDATGKITDFTVGNTSDDGEGHQGGGSGNVGPGDDAIELIKENTGYTAGTSDWKITFDVPKAGLTKAVVTDYLPNTNASGVKWVDILLPGTEPVITGLINDESYSIDTSDPEQVIITFYKTGEKTEANQGLQSSDQDRKITITLQTQNKEEWVVAYSGSDHWNHVSLNANNQIITAQDKSNPKSEGVAKTGYQMETVTKDGHEYPVFKYTISLYGVTDDSFTDNTFTVTDTYNSKYLELYNADTAHAGNDYKWIPSNKGWNQMDSFNDDGNGKITFTISKENLQQPVEGVYYSAYTLTYYMIVKEDKLRELEEASLTNPVELKNDVDWGTFHDDVTINYEYPAVDKEKVGSTVGNVVRYKVVLNPDKLTLNGGNDMEMTDTATNLSIDYSTMVITTDPEHEIEYYYRGNTGYFTIPDETSVTITYSARVIGDGTITYSNEVKMKHFSDSTENTERFDTVSGDGNLNIDWVLLYKHEYRKMNRPLNGAVYVLTDSEGNPILYPAAAGDNAGKPITFTTKKTDLHHLPDGNYVDAEGNILERQSDGTYKNKQGQTVDYVPDERDGYTWIFLDEGRDGMSLQKGVTYYFKEYTAPPGYQIANTVYQFIIAEHPDYDDWEYYKGDVLRLADSQAEGQLTVKKNFVGAGQLTDTQKKQIKFTITAKDAQGNAINFPYKRDASDQLVNTTDYKLEITYADFVNGEYKLTALPTATYSVVEEGVNSLGGYIYRNTVYQIDEQENQAGTGLEVAINAEEKEKHVVNFTNTYENPPGAKLNLIKTNEDGTIYLYGATFQLSKKGDDGEYHPVSNTEFTQLTEDGKFTIDYENRETGVVLTGLTPGDYMVQETAAPRDYQVDNTPIYFTVDSSYNIAGIDNSIATFGNDAESSLTVATVKNNISHTYTLNKVDEFRLSKKLNGAQFEIYEVTTANYSPSSGKVTYTIGEKEGETLTTNKDGIAVIDPADYNFDPTKLYLAKETKAPEGYKLSDEVYCFYTGDTAPSLATVMGNVYSVVSLYTGPKTAIVTNEEGPMDLYVRKQWYKVDGTRQGDEDITGTIQEIEVELYQVVTDASGHKISEARYPDEETTYKLTKGGAGNSSFIEYKFKDLPTGYSVNTDNPLTYTYYVKEIVPEGYEAKYMLDVNSNNNFNAEGAVSSASEATVGAATEKKEIQVMNAPEPIQLSMQKVWLDDDSHGGNNMTIHFKLKYRDASGVHDANDADIGKPTVQDAVDINLPRDANNGSWSYKWSRLMPFSSDGSKREYFVEEDNGHITTLKERGYIDPVYTTDENGNIVITNTKTESTNLSVKKVWLNADGTELTDDSKKTEIEVQLQRQAGKFEGSRVTIKTGNATKINQQFVATGEPISFTLRLEMIGDTPPTVSCNNNSLSISSPTVEDVGWTKHYEYNCEIDSVDDDVELALVAKIGDTNIEDYKYIIKDFTYQNATITAEGDIEDVSASIVPDSRVTLSSDNDWTKTWDKNSLPSDAGNGNQWYYSVREVNVPAGFDVSYVNNEGITTGFIYVENTKSDYTRATATKEWQSANGTVITAPANAQVVFALYQDGRRMAKTVTLDGTRDEEGESEPWVATWEGLERYQYGSETEHVYTIKEITGFTGYAAEYVEPVDNGQDTEFVASGGKIINRESRSLTVKKVWKDENGNVITGDIPPREKTVTIKVYKRDEHGHHTLTEYKTIVLDGVVDTEGEQKPWEATITGLDNDTVYVVEETSHPEDYSWIAVECNTATVGHTAYYIQVEGISIGETYYLRRSNGGGPDGGQYTSIEVQASETGNGVYHIRHNGELIGYQGSYDWKYENGQMVLQSQPKRYLMVRNGGGHDGRVEVTTSATDLPIYQLVNTSRRQNLEYVLTNQKKEEKTSGVVLPLTGGSGTTWFRIIGLLLLASAAGLYAYRKKYNFKTIHAARKGSTHTTRRGGGGLL